MSSVVYDLLNHISTIIRHDCLLNLVNFGLVKIKRLDPTNFLSAKYSHRIVSIDYLDNHGPRLDFAKRLYLISLIDDEVIVEELYMKRVYRGVKFRVHELFFGKYSLEKIFWENEWEVVIW